MLPPRHLGSPPVSGDFDIHQDMIYSTERQPTTLVIAATFTVEPIADCLNFWADLLDLPIVLEFAAYNQIFQALLDPYGAFATNRSGINIVLIRFEDWIRYHSATADTAPEAILERSVRELIQAVQVATERNSTPHILGMCPPSPEIAASSRYGTLCKRLEDQIAAELQEVRNLTIISSADLADLYPVPQIYDPHSDEIGHIPFTPAGFTAIGTIITRKLTALRRPAYKVIALDCDHTLWQGICGEDGAAGIVLSPAYSAFQELLVAQNKAGMLLCLCSKNNPADVWAVFDQRTDFPLKREHVVACQINWQSKSENLRSLAAELNLGLDSFLFIDDNPVECAEVQAHCPEVLTLQLPTSPTGLMDFVKHMWAFDRLNTTVEDRQRTTLYRQQIARAQAQAQALTFEAFLSELALQVELQPLTPENIVRAAQLTQRTNQFNLTTIRRSASELKQLCQSGQHEGWMVSVRDRFGDYGMTGLVIFRVIDERLSVDTLLLSCRVLSRGVEHQVLAWLGQLAQQRGLRSVELVYVPTAKNQPAHTFLEQVGASFRQVDPGQTRYEFPAASAAVTMMDPAPTGLPSADAPVLPTTDTTALPATSAATLSYIAAHLTTADQILRAIEAHQRRTVVESSGVYQPPRTPIESDLSDLWSKVLRLDRISITDNFFQIGGNSLIGTQLMARVRDLFQIDLPLISLFEAPTIAGLAHLIEQQQLAHASEDDLAEWLQEIDGLSDEEIKQLLTQIDSSASA